MSLQNYEDLNNMHMDVLKEICNIGSGNAANSLSQMFGILIEIEIPGINILDINTAIEKLGGAETVKAGLLLPIATDLNGMIMFLFSEDFAGILIKTLMGTEITCLEEIDEMGLSMLNEVANIAAAAFVNSIASMTGLKIDIAPPSSTIDMVGAIMNVPAVYFANVSDKILLMENRFHCGGIKTNAHVLLIPDIESLEKLMRKLGVET